MAISVIFPLVNPPYVVKGVANAGSAWGGGGSRAYAKIESREVFLRTVEIYARRDQVVQRLIIVPPDDLQVMQEKYSAHLGFQGVTVGGGGSDWFSCVARGLERLTDDVDVVMVHDPCCPAVAFTLLDAMEEALANNKAAEGVVPVLPSRSGFADLEGGRVSEYVDMARVYEVQSPQIFRRKSLVSAYGSRGKAGNGGDFVDDAEMMISVGHKIATVAGSRFNQRIDTDEMVRLGKDLIGHTPKPKPKTPLTPFGEAEW